MLNNFYSVDTNLDKLWEMVRDRESWHAAVHVLAELDTTWWLNNNSSYSSGSVYEPVLDIISD